MTVGRRVRVLPGTHGMKAAARIPRRMTLVVDRPFPKLDLRPGDVVTVEPGGFHPIVVHRDVVPNYGAILEAIEIGAAHQVGGALTVHDLAR